MSGRWMVVAAIVALVALAGCADRYDDDDDISADDDDVVDDDAADDDVSFVDEDGDGYPVEEDCDDTDPVVHPGAEEVCNGLDDDCDGVPGEDEVDGDGDGTMDCAGDCDDTDPDVHPGAEEVCNGVDDDCSGYVTADERDDDGDGYRICDGDCDDEDDDIYPGADGVIEVPADFGTIQEAIEAASTGDTICVAAGTYVENLEFTVTNIRVVGVGGVERTVIDGDGADSVVRFGHNETLQTVLEGFTVTGGLAAYGGGIYVNNSNPTLKDLLITSNTAESCGGGLYGSDAALILSSVTISSNVAGYGAGACFESSEPTMTSVAVVDNEAWTDHGGLWIWGGSAWIENIVVAANSAADSGGGMGVRYCSATLKNAVFAGNVAGSLGGGLCINRGRPTIENAVFVGNSADYGGGISVAVDDTPAIRNVALAHNTAYAEGGGIYVQVGSINVAYCSAWDNDADDYAGMTDPTGVAGNVAEDPHFLDISSSDPVSWNLHLGTGSALVDGGDPSIADPDGSSSDVGAYGGGGAGIWDLDGDGYPLWWQPGYYNSSSYPAEGWDCDDGDPTVYPGAGC